MKRSVRLQRFRISKLNLPFTVSFPAPVAILSLISTPFILPFFSLILYSLLNSYVYWDTLYENPSYHKSLFLQ